MWTATIKGKQRKQNKVFVIVEFSDGTEVFGDSIEANNDESLKVQVRSKITMLESAKTFFDGLALDAAVNTSVAAPTQAEIERQTFVTDYQKWLKVKRGIDVGILTGNEAPVTALKQKVIDEFKPAYLDLL